MGENGQDRLDSWKEIAAYLKRDASTVRRWEKAGLPVHRHRHNVRAAVYAYKSELDVWWNDRAARPESLPEPGAWPRRTVAWAAAAGFIILAAALTAPQWLAVIGHAAPPLQIRPFTSYTGSFRMPAFSPDGNRIAFSWTGPTATGWNIYVKPVDGAMPQRLTWGAGEDNAPAWAPDGHQIAFLRTNAGRVGIYVLPAAGGAERKLADVASGRYFNLQWTRDGKSIVFAEKTMPDLPVDSLNSHAIFLLSVETKAKRQLTFPAGTDTDHRFALSPDGATLAFIRHGAAGATLFTMPISGGQPRYVCTEHDWTGHVVWSPDGRSLIFTSAREGGNKLWRIPLTGGAPAPVSLAEEVVFSPTVSSSRARLAYVRDYSDTDLMRLELGVGPYSLPVPFAASARIETAAAFSPDGSRVAFFSEQSGRRELWMARADGTEPEQLTDFFAWETVPPSWSPDGRRLLFGSNHGPAGSAAGLFVLELATRRVRRVSAPTYWSMPSWSHDGQSIFVTDDFGTNHPRIARIPADGGDEQIVSEPGRLMARESPDGRYLYYLRASGGIWRRSYADGRESPVVEDFPVSWWANWTVGADGVYYMNQRTLPRQTLELFDLSTRRTRHIMSAPGEPLDFEGGMTVSADGQSLVYTRVSRAASDIMLVENFR